MNEKELSKRAKTVLEILGTRDKYIVRDNFKSGYLRKRYLGGEYSIINFGWKTYCELHEWCGLGKAKGRFVGIYDTCKINKA